MGQNQVAYNASNSDFRCYFKNVSNRVLAHAITGGLGMGELWNA